MPLNQIAEKEFVEQRPFGAPTKLSVKSWSLCIQDLCFTPNFGSFSNRFFNRSHQLGYFTLAYDYGCYFPKEKLNLKFAEEILNIRPGDRLNLGINGKEIFPEKKVNDCLQVGIFFFKSKMNAIQYKSMQFKIRDLIRQSGVLAEIERVCDFNEIPNKQRLDGMKNDLFKDIQAEIDSNKSDVLETFDIEYSVENEWTFFGLERCEKAEIEIQLNKKIC